MIHIVGVLTTCVPSNNDYGDDDYDPGGPYMTLEEFFSGVECGLFGPDEDCRWVHITEQSNLEETPIVNPKGARPDRTIAVAYYDK